MYYTITFLKIFMLDFLLKMDWQTKIKRYRDEILCRSFKIHVCYTVTIGFSKLQYRSTQVTEVFARGYTVFDCMKKMHPS